jgi:DNA-binding MarR family transcriptional regulator
MVDRLFQKGLVNRAVCPSDKRLVDVSLSDKGFELLEQMNNINQELDTIISEISSDEAALLNNLLDKIRG